MRRNPHFAYHLSTRLKTNISSVSSGLMETIFSITQNTLKSAVKYMTDHSVIIFSPLIPDSSSAL